MNGKLLAAAAFLILLGLLSSIVPLFLFGFLMLLAGLFVRGRTTASEEPRAPAPEPMAAPLNPSVEAVVVEPPVPSQPAASGAAPAAMAQNAPSPNFSPALFPAPILPAPNPIDSQAVAERPSETSGGAEIAEVAVLLALNWLASRLKS